MLTSSVKKNQPWASGPGEILQHDINLLQKDTDANRRLAMLSIDNAVELTIKTYLGLPRRVTGLSIRRKDFDEFSESFPKLLDALEQHAGKKLEGIFLCLGQTLEDMKAMALVRGIPHERFSELYWKQRPPYDRGDANRRPEWMESD